MSFCSDIKTELSNIRPSKCCKIPLTYGFLLFSRSFSVKKICMQTENEHTVQLYSSLIKSVYGVDVEICQGNTKRTTYRAEIPNEFDRLRVLASVDFGIADGKINRESLSRECCGAAFIRGAFLACGQISDPAICYRVDFSVRDRALAEELKTLLSEHYISANISPRGNGYVVYIKRSEMIVNLLTVMGASARSLELIETTIIKSVKNNMNRARNCDSANIGRTVEASITQRRAIDYLDKKGILPALSEELIEAATLRRENPELSLKELCKKSRNAITVSGLNHRLKRIMEIYEEHNNDCS